MNTANQNDKGNSGPVESGITHRANPTAYQVVAKNGFVVAVFNFAKDAKDFAAGRNAGYSVFFNGEEIK